MSDVQIAVSAVPDNQVIALGEDVSIITPPPESVSVVAATAVSMGGTSSVGALDDLSDVDTATVAPTDGQALAWDNTAQAWKPKTVPTTIAAQNDYSLRLSPDITGGRWNVKTTQDPASGQFWQVSTTSLMVDKFDSLGVDIIASLFPTANPSKVIWLSSDGITWTQRTAEIVPDNNFTRINIYLNTAYTSGSALFIETVDPSNGPATLPLGNKNVLTYNSGTQKWEPTPIGVSSLVDVDTATVAPTNGQALVWDQAAGKWEPGSIATTAQGALADTALQPTSSIDALADVDTSTAAPTDGQVLTWDQTAGQWTPAGIPPASLSTLDGIGNVDTATIPKQAGNALVWSGSKWVASQTNLAYTNSEGVDVNYNNTVLLLNFDHPAGTGSAGVVDISPSSKTFSGTGNITASPVKAGSGAWGSGTLTVNNTTGFTVNTGAGEALTIEFWAYSGDLASSRNLLNVRSTSSFTTTRIRIDTLGKVSWATGLTSSINIRITHPATIPVNTWFHVALTRQIGSASWRLHVDGVASSASTVADTFSAENAFQIGVSGVFIDLFRFTKGIARYGAATFTPSSTPFVAGNGFTPSSINTFDDVDTSTVTPTNGQALVWDQTTGKWEPGSVATTAQGALADTALQPTSSIDALADVDTSTTAPTDGQVLAWDQAAGKWEPTTPASGGSGDSLLSVPIVQYEHSKKIDNCIYIPQSTWDTISTPIENTLYVVTPPNTGGSASLYYYPSFNPDIITDPDASAYIAAVATADGQPLEADVRTAIAQFVLGCKLDGTWNAIKASCILAGAKTLNGALVPLKGSAPTNFNFVAGDYDRKTGLVGDGSTKYLGSNRLHNQDSLNNAHCSVYSTSLDVSSAVIGCALHGGGGSRTVIQTNNRMSCQSSLETIGAVSSAVGFMGVRRNNSSNEIHRSAGVSATATISSVSLSSLEFTVFARRTGTGTDSFSSGRLAFYSIGESLDLALLDARVTQLMAALAAAIP